MPDLLHLVWLRMAPLWLQIENFFNAIFGKDVMIPSYSFVEAQTAQQVTELAKRDVRVGRPAQYTSEQFVVSGHTQTYTTFEALCLI